ncbi:hypothetical protein [Streptomyces sp. NPDC047315]|uniref:hypothetical protein n=1 Tax=Streptomyces sp. NPDC047315 TaxID=3155142 RepID=UPI0033D78886
MPENRGVDPDASVTQQPESHRDDPAPGSAAAPPPVPPDAPRARPVHIDGVHIDGTRVDVVHAEAPGPNAQPAPSHSHSPSPARAAPFLPPPAADAASSGGSAPTPRVRAAEPPPSSPVVRVTIDHLVVRSAPPRAVDEQPAARPAPLLDLAEYLRTRGRA